MDNLFQPGQVSAAVSAKGPTVVVPDYELLRPIGKGAFGEVWLARSLATGALRAAKIVRRDRFDEDRPFQREFEGIQKFERISREHPSQLALFHIGRNEKGGYFYYVMELADDAGGGASRAAGSSGFTSGPSLRSDMEAASLYKPHTLRADLAQGRLPAERVVEIASALTEALGHLHGHGLVHRDVKPSNVVFVNGRPKLADIGLVTDASDQCSIVGTEGYLPPQGPGTAQADLFALGKLLYEAATGQSRLQFPELPSTLNQWTDAPLVLELNEICLKACAPMTRDRYASAADLLDDLQHLQRGKSIKKRRLLRYWQSVTKRAALAGSLCALLFAGGFWLLQPVREKYPRSAPEVQLLLDQANYTVLRGFTEDGLSNAAALFAEAIRLDPKSIPAHFGLWWTSTRHSMALNSSDLSERRILAKKLDQVAPDSAEAHVAAAELNWHEGKYPAALTEARLATQRRAACKESEAGAHFYYGHYLLRTGGSAEEAWRQFQLGQKLMPINPMAYQHFGDVYAAQHNFTEAIKQYEHCLGLEGNHILVLNSMARIYEQIGDFDKALDRYEEFAKRTNTYESDKPVFDKLRQAARHGDAKEYWNIRLDHELKDANPGHYLIATIYLRLQNKEKAYEHLRMAFEQDRPSVEELLTDPCWDHSDQEFNDLARRSGLLR